jgi:hypothetical protein
MSLKPTPICIPWRGGDPTREELWEKVRPWYESTGLPVFTGDSDPGKPFNRSGARNAAARAAGDWDVAFFVDADTLLPLDQVHAAIARARAERQAVWAYDRLYNFPPLELAGAAAEEPGVLVTVHNSHPYFAIPRPIWDDIGGFDERFPGWGWEDTAFFAAVNVLHPMTTIHGRAVMLKHDRTGVLQETGIHPPALVGRYLQTLFFWSMGNRQNDSDMVYESRRQMRRLVDEAKAFRAAPGRRYVEGWRCPTCDTPNVQGDTRCRLCGSMVLGPRLDVL